MITMYIPITNTIGTTNRPHKQLKIKKIRIDPQFKRFVKFNTVWNFQRVHAQHCKGHFEAMPHCDRSDSSRKVCTVCGAIANFASREFDTKQPREHRPQVIRQSNKTYEVIFTGYL